MGKKQTNTVGPWLVDSVRSLVSNGRLLDAAFGGPWQVVVSRRSTMGVVPVLMNQDTVVVCVWSFALQGLTNDRGPATGLGRMECHPRRSTRGST